jgi:uncharacterized protein (DUF433 family)
VTRMRIGSEFIGWRADMRSITQGTVRNAGWVTLKQGVLVMANLDWSQCPAVESIPGKVSGAWVLRGTRTPVKILFENLEAGMSIGEVIEQFSVNREQIDSLMAFVARSLEKAPTYSRSMTGWSAGGKGL